MDAVTLKGLFKQLLPVLLKYLLPLLGLSVAGYQGSLAYEGDATVGATALVSGGGILATIIGLISGFKLQGSETLKDFSAAAIHKALDFLDSAIDKVAVYLKDTIRQRLLQMLQKLYRDADGTNDEEATAAFAMLGSAHGRLVSGQKALVGYSPTVAHLPAPKPAPAPAAVKPATTPAPAPAPV